MGFNKETRIKVYNKCNGKCAYCGDEIDIKNMQIDHIIPKSNFFSFVKNNYGVPYFLNHLTIEDVDHFDNLHPSCRICNKFKDSFHLELFRNELQQQLTRTFKNHSSYRRALKFGQVKETPHDIVFYFENINK